MTKELARQVFDVPKTFHYEPQLSVFGFGKFIVLSCDPSGKSIVYYLSMILWDLLPANPLIPRAEESYVWYGKPMDLILQEWKNKTEADI